MQRSVHITCVDMRVYVQNTSFTNRYLQCKYSVIICSVAGGWDVEGKRRQPPGLWMKHLVSFTEMETVGEGIFQMFREKEMHGMKISGSGTLC